MYLDAIMSQDTLSYMIEEYKGRNKSVYLVNTYAFIPK